MANIFDQFDQQQPQAGGNIFDQFDPPEAPKLTLGEDIANQTGQGLNAGIDSTLNALASPVRVPINYVASKLGYGDEVIPPLELASRVNRGFEGGRDEAQTGAGRLAGAIGEVAGGSALPSAGLMAAGKAIPAAGGMLKQATEAPGLLLRNEALSAAGAGTGIHAARENNAGPVGEFVAGLAGGVVAPRVANTAASLGGAAKDGARYTSDAIDQARNPERAAINSVADAMVQSDTLPSAVIKELAPKVSPNFKARGIDETAVGEMISRVKGGEPQWKVAQDLGISEGAVGKYVRAFDAKNPSRRDIMDITRELKGEGGAEPVTNLGRSSQAISRDPVAKKRMTDEQLQQPGRVSDLISKTNVGGRNFDEQLDYLKGVAKQEEDVAYRAAEKAAQPVDIRGVLSAGRARAAGRGEISETMNKAVDLFYEAGLTERPQSPASKLRITEAKERLQDAIDNGAPDLTVNRLRRRLKVMKEQDDFSRPLINRKMAGPPISDTKKFKDQRRELSQMITNSKGKDGKNTPLTAELTWLYKGLNKAARSNNKLLEEADLKFSENRTVEKLMESGQAIGRTLTPQSRRTLREFKSLTSTQQEIVRLRFEQELADQALNTPRGNAAARAFNNDGFTQLVEALYPKSSGKEIFTRGRDMLRNLKTEAVKTEKTADVLRGSRTAPLADEIAEQKELAKTAANGITGKFWAVIDDLSVRLARQISQKAATEKIRILTTAEPDELFPLLVKLEKSAKTTAERQAYVTALRQLRRAKLNPGTVVGTATTATAER